MGWDGGQDRGGGSQVLAAEAPGRDAKTHQVGLFPCMCPSAFGQMAHLTPALAKVCGVRPAPGSREDGSGGLDLQGHPRMGLSLPTGARDLGPSPFGGRASGAAAVAADTLR